MNVKKAGLVSAGVLAAMVAASPLAWAVGPSGQADPDCSFSAEGADASAQAVGELPINAIVQTPTGGDNAGVFGQCSTFNQNNGTGNGEGNTFNGQPIPAPPAAPSLPEAPVPTEGLPPLPSVPSIPG